MRIEGLAAQARITATLTALTAIALALAAPAGASPAAPVTSRDRAATRAYLQAGLTYEQSLVASTPAANTAIERWPANWKADALA
jgi:hypothetical protein